MICLIWIVLFLLPKNSSLSIFDSHCISLYVHIVEIETLVTLFNRVKLRSVSPYFTKISSYPQQFGQIWLVTWVYPKETMNISDCKIFAPSDTYVVLHKDFYKVYFIVV